MEKTNRVKPHLTLLTSGQMEQIHQYALQILSKTGVRVDSDSVRELLKVNAIIYKPDRIFRHTVIVHELLPAQL